MKRAFIAALIWSGSLGLSPASAETAGPSSEASPSPYAGQHLLAIKTLDDAEVEGLLAGAGLGYAKAAELNGWPGPLHVLELRDRLSLTDEQALQMERLRREMTAAAVPLGRQLIEAERALNTLFAAGRPSADEVAGAAARIADIEARLRTVHLSAHLGAAPLLTRHQKMLYQSARGYGSGAGHGAGNGSGHGGHRAGPGDG